MACRIFLHTWRLKSRPSTTNSASRYRLFSNKSKPSSQSSLLRMQVLIASCRDSHKSPQCHSNNRLAIHGCNRSTTCFSRLRRLRVEAKGMRTTTESEGK